MKNGTGDKHENMNGELYLNGRCLPRSGLQQVSNASCGEEVYILSVCSCDVITHAKRTVVVSFARILLCNNEPKP